MAVVNFKNLMRSKVEHGLFRQKNRDFQKLFAAASIPVASQVSTVLYDWLSLHIQRNDKELQHFLKNRGLKKTSLLLLSVFNRVSPINATNLIAF